MLEGETLWGSKYTCTKSQAFFSYDFHDAYTLSIKISFYANHLDKQSIIIDFFYNVVFASSGYILPCIQ